MADEGRDGAELSVELARRIQEGDRAAWDALYARYRDPLLLSIRLRLGSGLRRHVESEDVLQSVLEDVLSDLARFEPRGPGSLSRWLHAAVLNKIRAQAERHGAQRRGGDARAADVDVDALAAREPGTLAYHNEARFGALERAVRSLPEKLRAVLVLRTVEGLTNAQAAEALGKSVDATSKLYHRALARLATLAPREGA